MSEFKTEDLFNAQLTRRYKLSDRLLGSGSFGHAFLCYDLEADEKDQLVCVAKIEKTPTASCFDEAETQLEHEHRVYTHLHKHPKLSKYLPKVHLFLQYPLSPKTTVPVLILERAGRDLLSLLLDHSDIPYYDLKTLGTLGVQMTRALKYMHSMFVVHRDIKPHNILICDSGQLKLIDFGLSMPIPATDDPNRRLYQSATCTLFFASWRQHFKHVCSARTDMESFMYTWIYLAGAVIPWDKAPSASQAGGKAALRELVGYMKRDAAPADLCSPFDFVGPDPTGHLLSDLFEVIRALKFDDTPPYTAFATYFKWLSQSASYTDT